MNITASHLLHTTFCCLALLISGTNAHADSTETWSFHPVKTAKGAAKLKSGSLAAVECDKCQGITVFKVDHARTYLSRFTCSGCKQVFTPVQSGRGDASGEVGAFIYVDKAGHTAHLSAR